MTISVSEMGTAKTEIVILSSFSETDSTANRESITILPIQRVNETSGAPGKIDGTAPESTRFGPVPVSVAMPPIGDEYAMAPEGPHA